MGREHRKAGAQVPCHIRPEGHQDGPPKSSEQLAELLARWDGIDVGGHSNTDGKERKVTASHPLRSFSSTCLLGPHINKTMEFLFLFLINYIIQTLKHL